MPSGYGYSLKFRQKSRISQLSDIIGRDYKSCRFVVEIDTKVILFATAPAQKKFHKIDCKNGLGQNIESVIRKAARVYYKDDIGAISTFLKVYEHVEVYFQNPKNQNVTILARHHFQWRKVLRELRVFVEVFLNEDNKPVAYIVTLKDVPPAPIG